MSEEHAIRCYEYVNCPYEKVRDALRRDALGLFQRATTAAATRAHALVSSLRVEALGMELGTDAVIVVRAAVEELNPPGVHTPRLRLSIEWRAARAPAFFPVMNAELSVYALAKDETQLDFVGRYEPPLGVVGQALDAVVGHRIAEATVHRFVRDLAACLHHELAEPRKFSAHA
jgi:hypothetical protein